MQTLKEITGEIQILASNEIGWGLDDNIQDATIRCRRSTGKAPKKFFIVPHGSEMDGLQIKYPIGAKFAMTEI